MITSGTYQFDENAGVAKRDGNVDTCTLGQLAVIVACYTPDVVVIGGTLKALPEGVQVLASLRSDHYHLPAGAGRT